MAERTKRRGPWLKLLMATGVLGGGGAGVYEYASPAASDESPVETATLDAAQQAWGANPTPVVEQPANPLGTLPLPPADLPPAPPAPSDRYAATPLPFPLEEAEPEIARGQNPSDEYDLPPAPAANPLRAASNSRYGQQPLRAQQAFEEESAQDIPPAALAAFEAPVDDHHELQQPIEPLSDEPPAPLGAPLPPQDIPLDALPQAPAGLPVADSLPPMPMDAPNPLRSLPVNDEPLPVEPLQHSAPADEPAYASEPPTAPRAFMEPQATPEPMSRNTATIASNIGEQDPLTVSSSVEGAGRPGERALEGRQQPTLAIQKFAPAEIQVGKPCKFLVKVRNTGQRPALNVVVHDEVPAGVRLMATTPQADSLGGKIAWPLGELAAGEERTLEMEVTPLEEGQIGSVATVSFSASASVQAKCTRPQLAIRMTAPSKVLVGQQQQIQIEIKNPGTGTATGVVIYENVPENLKHAAGSTLEFEVGDLAPGETRRLQLNMQAESAGQVVNVLTAQADGNLHVDQKVEFEVVAPALQIAVDGPKRRYLERPADYTVKIGNPGTASARDLRLVTQLPRGMKFVKANNMGEYDAGTHAVYWSLAELPAGESGAVMLTALPVAPGDHQLEVRAESADGLRDQASLGTQVEGIAALKFSVIDMEDPIEVGGETEYEVRVANQGTKAATNVTVQVAAPAGMRVVAAEGETRHNMQGGIVAFEPIRQLAPNAETKFRVRVQGVRPGDHRLVVEVGSDDLAQPVRKEESTRVFGDE